MKTKIFIALALCITIIAFAFAQNNSNSVELPDEVREWERLAEMGDTIAMHKLLRFYDDNSPVDIEVVEVIEVESDDEYLDTAIVVDDTIECDTVAVIPDEMEIYYSARLEYWLSKGLEINDPIATYIKGMRLYYTDETQALEYLVKSADCGNSQAALYCGSAYFNQGHIDKAIKYQAIAYNAGVPSAGWHLAMCLARNGDDASIEKAVEYMRHSAMLDYPEAVLEMKRIEPTNKLWQQKADSLEIDFADFPIIPTE